ncbi:MAG TPA: phospholipid-binding protein [Trichocoleus sp.]
MTGPLTIPIGETDMGFLGKLFGRKEEEKAAQAPRVAVQSVATQKSIPPEKVGIDGEFDESGLAKRVAKAFDDANISDDVGLWVAQTGSTVVLKYNPDAQGVLERAKQIAQGVDGATAVRAEPNS